MGDSERASSRIQTQFTTQLKNVAMIFTMKYLILLLAIGLSASAAVPGSLLRETFDDSEGFTCTCDFFTDGTGKNEFSFYVPTCTTKWNIIVRHLRVSLHVSCP